jgi:hypothetical protein
MKNELRIGNFINCVFSTRHCEVVEITTDDLKLKNGYADYSQIEPIPLTEEWLLKFGFEKEYFYGDDAKFIWWQLNDFGLEIFNTNKEQGRTSIESKDVGFFYEPMYMDYIEIKHVHQLQNLYFALTGEELTLKEI